jgi:PAS domain S-box-containing protein
VFEKRPPGTEKTMPTSRRSRKLSRDPVEPPPPRGQADIRTSPIAVIEGQEAAADHWLQLASVERSSPIGDPIPENYYDLFVLAPVAYARLDSLGVVEEINHAGCELLGDQTLHLINRPFVVFVAKEDRSSFLEHMRRCRSHAGLVETELILEARDGRSVTARLSSRRAMFGGRKVYWTVLIDLTERNALIEARMEAEAAQRLAQREEQMARALVEAKDKFLAMLSHELRTPLTPALVGASFLALQDLPPNVKDVAAMIRRNIDLEARLIDDLLDVTRITRGHLRLAPEIVDLRSLTEEVIELCSVEGSRRPDVRMVKALDTARTHVRVDPTRLRQVLWNLINNAWKFTDRGQIMVMLTNPHPEVVAVRVSDTGVGMDGKTIARLFRPFEQGDLENRRGGLGLGLTICKGIMDAHGGSIRATSAGSGHGSAFEIELPAVDGTSAAESPDEEAPGARKRGRSERVLLVEDHEDTANVVAWLLKREGYFVEVARTFHEANAVIDQPWDLVITDLGLPDGSGLDLGREIAKKDPRPRMIAISGWGAPKDLQASRAAGFDKHLVKPVDIMMLLKILNR